MLGRLCCRCSRPGRLCPLVHAALWRGRRCLLLVAGRRLLPALLSPAAGGLGSPPCCPRPVLPCAVLCLWLLLPCSLPRPVPPAVGCGGCAPGPLLPGLLGASPSLPVLPCAVFLPLAPAWLSRFPALSLPLLPVVPCWRGFGCPLPSLPRWAAPSCLASPSLSAACPQVLTGAAGLPGRLVTAPLGRQARLRGGGSGTAAGTRTARRAGCVDCVTKGSGADLSGASAAAADGDCSMESLRVQQQETFEMEEEFADLQEEAAARRSPRARRPRRRSRRRRQRVAAAAGLSSLRPRSSRPWVLGSRLRSSSSPRPRRASSHSSRRSSSTSRSRRLGRKESLPGRERPGERPGRGAATRGWVLSIHKWGCSAVLGGAGRVC